MYREQPLEAFLAALAARTPTPGGGAASALAAAAGAAQAAMGAAFTMGSERFQAVEPEARRLHDQFQALWRALLDLMEEDSRAYLEFSAARKQAREKKDPESRQRLDAARERATRAPEAVVAQVHEALLLTRQLARICNPALLGDVAVAAWLLEGAARGAALQARANLKGRPDAAERAGKLRAYLRECEEAACEAAETVQKGLGLSDDTK